MITELKDLLNAGELLEGFPSPSDDYIEISADLVARIFREFNQLKDEVDILTGMLGQPCVPVTTITEATTVDKETKMEDIVTELYKDTDIISIVDSINKADCDVLSELADLVKDQGASPHLIGDKFLQIMQEHYEWEAADELF